MANTNTNDNTKPNSNTITNSSCNNDNITAFANQTDCKSSHARLTPSPPISIRPISVLRFWISEGLTQAES